MSLSADEKYQLRSQLAALSDAAITTEQLGELHTRVKTNAEACQLYVEHLLLDALLNWSLDKEADMSLHAAPGAALSGATIKIGRASHWRYFPMRARFVAIAASVLLVGYFAALAGLVVWDRIHPRNLHQDLAVQSSTGQFAKLIRTEDCQWEANSPPAAVGAWVPANVMHLQKGTVELQFADGAQVIIEGPAKFEAQATGRGFLRVGKLVARVPKQAIGFTVETPTATVVDLGTEFGVEVTQEQQSRVHVFQGKVALRANLSGTSATGAVHEIELREGEAASIGTKGALVRHSGAEAQTAVNANSFIRKRPGKIIKVLNLADVVAGGNGFGKSRSRGIDPTTGKVTALQGGKEGSGLITGEDGYHRVENLPFVDGVFIPRGKNAVQLDSAGHTFADFPSTDNHTHGLIWAGGVIPQDSADGINRGAIAATLNGVDYSTNLHSLLSMHANKGITFNLQTIRQANPGHKIMRFVALAGNAASFSQNVIKYCDLWVFVDGQPRFSRERMTVQQEFKVAVDLDDQSHFLSLVVTDGGDGFDGDQVIVADPCLVLSQTAAGEAAEEESTTNFVSEKSVREVARTAKPASRVLWIDLQKAGTATQSSEHPVVSCPAPLAIDGDPQTVAHTHVDDSAPWWQIDMGSTHPIAVVVLSNRQTAGGLRVGGWLRDITVKIIAEDGKTVVTSSPLLNPKNSEGGGGEQDFEHGPPQITLDFMRAQGKPAVGRFVRIERKSCMTDEDRSKIAPSDIFGRACRNALVLSEVQVFELPAQAAAEVIKNSKP